VTNAHNAHHASASVHYLGLAELDGETGILKAEPNPFPACTAFSEPDTGEAAAEPRTAPTPMTSGSDPGRESMVVEPAAEPLFQDGVGTDSGESSSHASQGSQYANGSGAIPSPPAPFSDVPTLAGSGGVRCSVDGNPCTRAELIAASIRFVDDIIANGPPGANRVTVRSTFVRPAVPCSATDVSSHGADLVLLYDRPVVSDSSLLSKVSAPTTRHYDNEICIKGDPLLLAAESVSCCLAGSEASGSQYAIHSHETGRGLAELSPDDRAVALRIQLADTAQEAAEAAASGTSCSSWTMVERRRKGGVGGKSPVPAPVALVAAGTRLPLPQPITISTLRRLHKHASAAQLILCCCGWMRNHRVSSCAAVFMQPESRPSALYQPANTCQ
jgi:hypothetical protein